GAGEHLEQGEDHVLFAGAGDAFVDVELFGDVEQLVRRHALEVAQRVLREAFGDVRRRQAVGLLLLAVAAVVLRQAALAVAVALAVAAVAEAVAAVVVLLVVAVVVEGLALRLAAFARGTLASAFGTAGGTAGVGG